MTSLTDTMRAPVTPLSIGPTIPAARSKAANVALWLAQIAVAALFLFAGSSKLGGDPQMVQVFDTIGVGQWFRYLTGGIEVVAAAALVLPSLAYIGAAVLAVTMVGAVITHLFVIGGSVAMPVVLLVATSIIAWTRRPR